MLKIRILLLTIQEYIFKFFSNFGDYLTILLIIFAMILFKYRQYEYNKTIKKYNLLIKQYEENYDCYKYFDSVNNKFISIHYKLDSSKLDNSDREHIRLLDSFHTILYSKNYLIFPDSLIITNK